MEQHGAAGLVTLPVRHAIGYGSMRRTSMTNPQDMKRMNATPT
ncbi:MAG: hypothetical protein NW217_14355 [Hyphomicrobiaceae bacterium]|nr:hypothetical protein [Hyphomicrobiaceae bacterium]